jgi:hypothetical protein
MFFVPKKPLRNVTRDALMCGKKERSFGSRKIPANRSLRVVTRRATEEEHGEEHVCRSSLLMLIPQVEQPPYKEV